MTSNELIEPLQRLGNFDVNYLRTIIQGEAAESVAPQLSQWAEQNLDAELTRRHTLHEYTYTSLFPENWENADLLASVAFMLAVTRTAAQAMTPASQDWCFMLTGLLVEEMAKRLMGGAPQ